MAITTESIFELYLSVLFQNITVITEVPLFPFLFIVMWKQVVVEVYIVTAWE